MVLEVANSQTRPIDGWSSLETTTLAQDHTVYSRPNLTNSLNYLFLPFCCVDWMTIGYSMQDIVAINSSEQTGYLWNKLQDFSLAFSLYKPHSARVSLSSVSSHSLSITPLLWTYIFYKSFVLPTSLVCTFLSDWLLFPHRLDLIAYGNILL